MTARNTALDGIRGISLILILLWHYIVSQAQPQYDSALDHLVQNLALTWSGVDLFFVLSGFLIVGILLDAKGSASYFKTFYIRRACRILPLYLVMVCLFITLPHFLTIDWLFADPLPLASYLTFTQNFFMHNVGFGPHWLGVTWTLAVEEQFYLLIPVLVWKLSKKQLFFLFLALVCLAPIFRLLMGNLGAYVLPFARADSIFMGGLLAILYQTPHIRAWMVENRGYLLATFLVFFAGTIAPTRESSEIGTPFNHLWLGVFYSLFILVNVLNGEGRRNWLVGNPVFVWLGLRSYAIYLFHQPVSGLVHHYLNGNAPHFSGLEQFQATALALVIVLILAELSYRYVESVFINYGRKYLYENSARSFPPALVGSPS